MQTPEMTKQTQMNEAERAFVENQREDLADDRRRTRRGLEAALQAARDELDVIEREYAAADAGEAYRRVGQIRGVSGVDVFAAFEAIEREAEFEKFVKKMEVSR